MTLTQAVKHEARRLGFALAGVTTPEPPPHWLAFQNWLALGRHGSMDYLRDPRRADPRLIFPECQSILVLATRYPNPGPAAPAPAKPPAGRVAAYAWGRDYHLILPELVETLAAFIEVQAGSPVAHKTYTDTGPLLERDLAQQAGLGWIGKNTCLISPQIGSYFFLAELLLNIPLDPDPPFTADRCGNCHRCIDACPTGCILPDRTIDARRCISFLTIENKGEIPEDLRPLLGNHIFGCDLCQQACPWNQRAVPDPEPVFKPRKELPATNLISELALTPQEFNHKFTDSPLQRAKRRGYLRSVAVALGNSGNPQARSALEAAARDPEPLISQHARWALVKLNSSGLTMSPKLLIATNNKGKVAELRELLNGLPVDLVIPAEIGLKLEVEEDGSTYAENAVKKALAFAAASGLVSLADDSGLEVDALDGQPGLHSARYSPQPGATDADRRRYLLGKLTGHPRPWSARFRATVAVAVPGKTVQLVVGICEGQIIPEERGLGGFGYDPIFLLPERGQTMAELPMEEKNRLSHRARAVQNAIPILKEIFGV